MEDTGTRRMLGKAPGGMCKESPKLFLTRIRYISAITDIIRTITEDGTEIGGGMNAIGIGRTGVIMMSTTTEETGTTMALIKSTIMATMEITATTETMEIMATTENEIFISPISSRTR